MAIGRSTKSSIGIRYGRRRQARRAGGTPTALSELQRPSAISGANTRTTNGEIIKQSAGQSTKLPSVSTHERSRRAAVMHTADDDCARQEITQEHDNVRGRTKQNNFPNTDGNRQQSSSGNVVVQYF